MLVATTWYFNDEFGNISRVVANQAGTSVYAAAGASGMDYVSTGQVERACGGLGRFREL